MTAHAGIILTSLSVYLLVSIQGWSSSRQRFSLLSIISSSTITNLILWGNRSVSWWCLQSPVSWINIVTLVMMP
jgi:hypothetical protein